MLGDADRTGDGDAPRDKDADDLGEMNMAVHMRKEVLCA